MPYSRERTSFVGSLGDRLDARLDLPSGDPRAYALFAHCFTCSKDVAAAAAISAGLAERGVAVLRFDFTGLGHSDGEFANTDFSSNVEDLILAADMLRETYRAPSVLIGHSLGGAAMLAAAPHVPEAVAVVTIGAPFDPAHVTELFPDQALDEIRRDGQSTVELAGRRFTVRDELLRDLAAQPMQRVIGDLRRSLLVMHSPIDEVVGIDNARRIFEAARHPKSFVSLDGADHLLTDRSAGAYAAEVLSSWVGRYLPTVSDQNGEVDRNGRAVNDDLVSVTESGAGRFTQEVSMRGHHLIADEPHGIGDDRGPTPYDLLLAALGTCTAMTLRMYADRAGLPLEHVSVTLGHDRVHSTDCRDASLRRCLVDHVTRTLHIVGPELTEEQHEKLLQIADKCPVHRTLVGDVRITTTLDADGTS